MLEESENLKEEKERLLKEKVTLEALEEMTDLPMKRIKQIADRVKHKAVQKERSTSPGKIIGWVIGSLVIIFVGYLLISIISLVIAGQREDFRTESRHKAEADYSRLVSAAGSGNLEMVQYHVIEEKIPVELEGYENETALMAAVRNTHTDVINFLLEQGGDVLKRNSEGRSVMDIADDGSNLIVKKIISIALVNTTPENSPIRKLHAKGHHYSEKSFLSLLDKRDTRALKLFIEADQGPYARDYDKNGILIAAEKGYLEIVKLLYTEGKNLGQNMENRALIPAVEEGHIDVIDFLLQQGGDINYKITDTVYASKRNDTLLIRAIEEDSEAVEYLLKKGADPNLTGGEYDMLPINLALYWIDDVHRTDSRIKKLDLFFTYGADLNKKDGNGFTPLEYALTVRYDDIRESIIKKLIKAGAEIPMTEGFFRELIYLNDVDHVKMFLDQGMDPDLQGFHYNDPQTNALIQSVILKYYRMSKLLIEYGADVNFKTSVFHRTPLLMAVINEDVKTVRLLLNNGARPDKDVITHIKDHYTYTNYEPQETIRALINKYK